MEKLIINLWCFLLIHNSYWPSGLEIIRMIGKIFLRQNLLAQNYIVIFYESDSIFRKKMFTWSHNSITSVPCKKGDNSVIFESLYYILILIILQSIRRTFWNITMSKNKNRFTPPPKKKLNKITEIFNIVAYL